MKSPRPDESPESLGNADDASPDHDGGPFPSAEDEFVISVADVPSDPDIPNRLWIKAIVPLLQLRSVEDVPAGRVGFAFDQMQIAACERLSRILRSDLDALPD
ncbi:hypothetical protein [Aquisphaera insulae]|uniref:hypothetical protein n=1 Tax=Aquisphaera insulae TaxID=2712864 RepID=UPI0013ED2833|nr:hypothetical protein [Aquisphaera insulae]